MTDRKSWNEMNNLKINKGESFYEEIVTATEAGCKTIAQRHGDDEIPIPVLGKMASEGLMSAISHTQATIALLLVLDKRQGRQAAFTIERADELMRELFNPVVHNLGQAAVMASADMDFKAGGLAN